MPSLAWSRSIGRISIIACVAVACDVRGSGRASAAAPIIRDSAGVTIVENTAADPASMPRWSIDTTPAITIGKTEGDSAYEFSSIGGVQRLPNGMIVVLNGRGEAKFEFRFYDSTGKHIATHGRLGQGPGEYRWINFFGPVGGDTVIGVDFPNSRLNWVSAAAGHLRSVRLDENGFRKLLGNDAHGVVETMVPLGDSVYAVVAFRSIPGSRGQDGQSYHIVDLRAGAALDLIRYDQPPARVLQLSQGPTHLTPPNAGDPAHVVDRARRRICALINTVTQITCVDQSGKRRIIRWLDDVVPYTADDGRAEEERLRTMWTRFRMPPQDIATLLAAMESPDRHKPVTAFQIDTDGNFWILEPVLDAAKRRRARFRVIAPDGQHIAFADSFPARNVGHNNTIHIGNDAVLRAFENADGAPAVGVFRIRKPK